MAYREFNGGNYGDVNELTLDDSDHIQQVNGKANWIIWADTTGRSLEISDQKDGEGSLTLRGFGSISIHNQKNGSGQLIVESDCDSIRISRVDGQGDVILKNPGSKTIGDKNGDSNIRFAGKPPKIGRKDGNGQIIKL